MQRIPIIFLALGILAAAEPATPNPLADIMSAVDANGDGKLSRDEVTAAIQRNEAHLKAEEPALYRKLDVDGDGRLSASDVTAAVDALLAATSGLTNGSGTGSDGTQTTTVIAGRVDPKLGRELMPALVRGERARGSGPGKPGGPGPGGPGPGGPGPGGPGRR